MLSLLDTFSSNNGIVIKKFWQKNYMYMYTSLCLEIPAFESRVKVESKTGEEIHSKWFLSFCLMKIMSSLNLGLVGGSVLSVGTHDCEPGSKPRHV